jgi:hypothetical protein
LIETIHELGGWRNTTYLQTKVGINGSLLNQFMKLRGTISRSDAIKIADRLRSHLRSHDQAFDAVVSKPTRKMAERKTTKKAKSTSLVINAEQWITANVSAETKMKIAAIASLLDSIIEQVTHANAPPKDQILTDIERHQLIAILETALNVLRSPLVERGLLKKTVGALKAGAESAIEKGVQQGLGKLMESTSMRIFELIAHLFS